MDQNYQINDESIFFTPVKKNAAYYRKEARARLLGKWKTGYLVSFLAIILGAAGSLLSFDLDKEDLERITSFDPQQLLPLLSALLIFGSLALITTLAIELFVSGPCEIGYHRFHLAIVDQNDSEVAVATLFGFFKKPHFFKAVLLRILRALVRLVTLLPLFAAYVLAAINVVSAYLLSPTLGNLILPILYSAAMILSGTLASLAIALPLSYAYTAAPFIMADYPGVGAVEAMRNSRHLMRGHKWKLFCLDFSFIGWMLLGTLLFGIGIVFVLPYFHTARALYYNDISRREAAKETEFPSLDPDDYMPNDSTI